MPAAAFDVEARSIITGGEVAPHLHSTRASENDQPRARGLHAKDRTGEGEALLELAEDDVAGLNLHHIHRVSRRIQDRDPGPIAGLDG